MTFKETHPWITFSLDLRKASYITWLLLGEAQSKCEHIAGIPLLPNIAKEMHKIFLAKGALATTAIEGNTLSEDEVMKHLEGKLQLPPSKKYLAQEIDNIVTACNYIADKVITQKKHKLFANEIKKYNGMVLKDLPLDDDIVPGEYRKHNVVVARYRGVTPDDCEHLLNKLCEWLNNEFTPPNDQYDIAFGILKSIIAHIYLAWIHPFGDGNGRTARLVELHILLSVGIPTAAAHLLSNHYNSTRQEYYRQLDHASKTGGNIFPFIIYALQGYVDGLKSQIEMIKIQQLSILWRDYVYSKFRDKEREPDIRRRKLVLDLSKKKDPVPLSEIRLISPKIAEFYATKTSKTISRDLDTLMKMNLIISEKNGFRAYIEQILAFLPASTSANQL